jgi:ABC-type uncharacterized transport system permease subunit
VSLNLADVLFLLAAAAYVLATALFGLFLFRRDAQATRSGKLAPHVVAVGAVLHGAQIVVASCVLRVCPVEGVHFPLSVVAVLMVVAYTAMRRRFRIDVVGAFVAPLALASLLAYHFTARAVGSEQVTRVQGALLPFHIVANLAGVALFALAFGAATLYLVQEHLLKEKRLDGLFQRLPPLDSLDRAEHLFLLAGFPLLTLGVLTGTLWAGHGEAVHFADVARAIFGYATWGLSAGVLFLRSAAGWRGRRAAYGTIAGFAFAVLVLVSYGTRPVAPVALAGTNAVAMAAAR